jgi:hypothetical protein
VHLLGVRREALLDPAIEEQLPQEEGHFAGPVAARLEEVVGIVGAARLYDELAVGPGEGRLVLDWTRPGPGKRPETEAPRKDATEDSPLDAPAVAGVV